MKKKITIYIVCAVIVIFLIYNLIWYFGIYRTYKSYQKDFPEISDSGVHIYVDDENYQYSVKMPTYLCWNGNLAIAEKNVDHALIIWLGLFDGEDRKGVILTSESGESLQLELENNKEATESQNQDIIDENMDLINSLYQKANNVWDLELR